MKCELCEKEYPNKSHMKNLIVCKDCYEKATKKEILIIPIIKDKFIKFK